LSAFESQAIIENSGGLTVDLKNCIYITLSYRAIRGEFSSLALRLAKAKTKQKPVNRMIYRLLFFHPNQKPAKNINILVSDSVSRTEAEIYSPDSLQHITKQDVQKLNIL
jgi:hypothetical protein